MNYGSEFVRAISIADMVAYAGATWDWHRLHYDESYARARGLRGPVVDGQMLGALMALQGVRDVGPDFRLTSMNFRLRSMVYAGDRVRLVTRATADSARSVALSHRIVLEDRLAAEGASEFKKVVA